MRLRGSESFEVEIKSFARAYAVKYLREN